MGKEDYKNEKKGHGFLCVPKELLFDNRYKQLTIEAILLYAYMLDRLKLSIENGWKDSDGKVFIYFSLESIMDLLKCSKGKAISTLKELDEKHGIGLIEKKRSGYGKCSRIYALIDEDNSVRVIDAYVDSLDLIELGFKEYSGTNRGQAPYRRSDLLKLHIYGYLNKIRSSRSLEIECKRNLELMWLINAITPDHGTIAGFVKNNRKAFHVTLRNLTLILKGWGLIDGKLIAIDGTKIRAQNSKHNCITKSGLDKKIAYADEQINAYLMALEKDSLL